MFFSEELRFRDAHWACWASCEIHKTNGYTVNQTYVLKQRNKRWNLGLESRNSGEVRSDWAALL